MLYCLLRKKYNQKIDLPRKEKKREEKKAVCQRDRLWILLVKGGAIAWIGRIPLHLPRDSNMAQGSTPKESSQRGTGPALLMVHRGGESIISCLLFLVKTTRQRGGTSWSYPHPTTHSEQQFVAVTTASPELTCLIEDYVPATDTCSTLATRRYTSRILRCTQTLHDMTSWLHFWLAVSGGPVNRNFEYVLMVSRSLFSAIQPAASSMSRRARSQQQEGQCSRPTNILPAVYGADELTASCLRYAEDSTSLYGILQRFSTRYFVRSLGAAAQTTYGGVAHVILFYSKREGCEFVCSRKQEHEKSTFRENVIPGCCTASMPTAVPYRRGSRHLLSAILRLLSLSLSRFMLGCIVQAAVCIDASYM